MSSATSLDRVGFFCGTQAEQVAGVHSLHLAALLASRLTQDTRPGQHDGALA